MASPLRPSTLLAIFLFLLVASPSMGEEVLARESDGNSGFGGFLRRLMIDVVAWLASLLGFNADSKHSTDDDASETFGGNGDAGGRHRFPLGSRRLPSANPEDVETIPSGTPELTSAEDRVLEGTDANPSLVELIQGVANLHGRAKGRSGADASVEQLGADVAPLAPERVTE